MLNRRDFLKNTSLLAVGATVPEFIARTARAAEPGEDTVLVVLEMAGGNDGLNTVVPFADDLYYKLRPKIGIRKADLQKVNESIGLHPRLWGLSNLLQKGQLAIVQGVGYPNPDRSHFESMDVWQLGDPRRQEKAGWLARAAGCMTPKENGFLGMQVGPGKAPLALTGSTGGIISLGEPESFELSLTGAKDRETPRRNLLNELNSIQRAEADDLTAFVQRRQLQTFQAVQKIHDALKPTDTASKEEDRRFAFRVDSPDGLAFKLQTVFNLIRKGLGARIYYVSIDGFDTHSDQSEAHANLLGEVGGAVEQFFRALGEGLDKRVLLMTYSEFGRRVKENASRGTDHGAASCLFVAGPGVKAGPVGKYPRLDDLDDGDLKYGVDFRRVYATLLDRWLKVDSRQVLGSAFEHLELVKQA